MSTYRKDLRGRLRDLQARARERRWRRIVEGWSRSGMSQRLYARRRGISLWSFRWWLYELRRRDSVRIGGPGRPSSGSAGGRAAEPARSSSAPPFLPVKVVQSPTKTPPRAISSLPTVPIEVVVGDRRRIRVSGDFDAALLAKLVTALEAAP